METLIQKIQNIYGGEIRSNDTIVFTHNDNRFCLTDGTLYCVTDDMEFLPGFTRVKTIRAVQKFVSLRD
jgi:hypothetical protein